MAFVIRIELHHTHDYDQLHVAMAARGMHRTITASSGEIYQLPTGTYYFPGESTGDAVRAAAVDAAKSIGHVNPAVLVVDSKNCFWQGLQTVSAYRRGA